MKKIGMGVFWVAWSVVVFGSLLMSIHTVAGIHKANSNPSQALVVPEALKPFLNHPAIAQEIREKRITFRHIVHGEKEGWMMSALEPKPEIRELYRLLPKNMCDPVILKYPYQRGFHFGYHPYQQRFMLWRV